MGIPFMFSFIVKNYPTIIKKYVKDVLKVDNLYLDCNSIIYDAVYKMDTNVLTQDMTNTIISRVVQTIKDYISLLKPTKNVMIAFDGVAPVAKLEQQRSRRFKSIYQNSISRSIFKDNKPDPWNTTAITPGTLFMQTLDDQISRSFKNPSDFRSGLKKY